MSFNLIQKYITDPKGKLKAYLFKVHQRVAVDGDDCKQEESAVAVCFKVNLKKTLTEDTMAVIYCP